MLLKMHIHHAICDLYHFRQIFCYMMQRARAIFIRNKSKQPCIIFIHITWWAGWFIYRYLPWFLYWYRGQSSTWRCGIEVSLKDNNTSHYNDVIMRTMASQITSLMIAFSAVYSGTDQRKHQSSASPAFVRGIHRWPVNSPHKGPVTRKMFPFEDVIMGRQATSKHKATCEPCVVIGTYQAWVHRSVYFDCYMLPPSLFSLSKLWDPIICFFKCVEQIHCYLNVFRTCANKELRFLKSGPYRTWDCPGWLQ